VTINDVGEVNSEKFNCDANVITDGVSVANITLVVLSGRYVPPIHPIGRGAYGIVW